MIPRRIFLLVLPLVLVACMPRVVPVPSGPRTNLLTQAELIRYSNVGEAVESLRSTWLVRRSPNAPGFAPRSPVWVYRDGTRVGGVDVLKLLSIAEVSYVEHVDARRATHRWGQGHENGVIHVTSR